MTDEFIKANCKPPKLQLNWELIVVLGLLAAFWVGVWQCLGG